MGVMTELGPHATAVAALPGDFDGVARVLHGLYIHEFLGDMYGVSLTDDERQTVHLRRSSDLLDAVVGRDDRPLDVAREPGGRVATNCRGFTVLAVALLRAHGVPARARCGFGMYFTEGWGEDHWVVEYQHGGRWKRGDAQIDDVQRKAFGIDFDLADLPEEAFLTGGEAWQRVRGGSADPSRFGLSSIGEAGDWWIAGNLMRDLADVEVLPWDCWGEMPSPGAAVDVALFDRLAASDERLAVPDQVYNALRKRVEPLVT